MPYSREIDPATGGYTMVAGAPKKDPTVCSDVVLRLRTPRGSVRMKGMEKFGSRLHLVKKNSAGTERRSQRYVEEALDDLVKTGRVRNLNTIVDVQSTTGAGAALQLVVEFTDTSGEQQRIPYTVRQT